MGTQHSSNKVSNTEKCHSNFTETKQAPWNISEKDENANALFYVECREMNADVKLHFENDIHIISPSDKFAKNCVRA